MSGTLHSHMFYLVSLPSTLVTHFIALAGFSCRSEKCCGITFPCGRRVPPQQKARSFSPSIVCLSAPPLTSFVLLCVPLDSAVFENETGAGSSGSAAMDLGVRLDQRRIIQCFLPLSDFQSRVQLRARCASQQTENGPDKSRSGERTHHNSHPSIWT